jgi:hypothetical protein
MATPNWVRLKIHMPDGQVKCARIPVETDRVVEVNMEDIPTTVQLAIFATSNPNNPYEMWDSFSTNVSLRDYRQLKKHIEHVEKTMGTSIGKNL